MSILLLLHGQLIEVPPIHIENCGFHCTMFMKKLGMGGHQNPVYPQNPKYIIHIFVGGGDNEGEVVKTEFGNVFQINIFKFKFNLMLVLLFDLS